MAGATTIEDVVVIKGISNKEDENRNLLNPKVVISREESQQCNNDIRLFSSNFFVMKFFRQLLLLLWKNFNLRKQNKVRIIVEIIAPLFLFLILAWVRTRGLRKNYPDCIILSWRSYFVEKPLPSAGLLPFLRGYICETNDTCYNYDVNNNYDNNFFKNASILVLNITDVTYKIVNSITPKQFNGLIDLVNALIDQRNVASSYTRNNVLLVDTVFNKATFINEINNNYLISFNQTFQSEFLNSSPNFNLLYNRTYSQPFDDTNSIGVSPAFYDLLYGSDLDIVNRTSVPLDDQNFVRGHICNTSLTDTKQMFRTNNVSNNDFYKNLCSLNDTSLLDLVKFVSSNLDLDKVRKQVSSNTYLDSLGFIFEVSQGLNILYQITSSIQNINGVSNLITNTLPQFQELISNASIPNVICGSSNASVFNYIRNNNTNINNILNNSTLPLNGTIPGTNTSISTNDTASIIGLINGLASLNHSDCPVIYSNYSTKSCLCETIYSILENTPGIKILWNQLEPVFLGKLLYAPNTTVYNNLIKKINSTFALVDELTNLLTQASVVINSIDNLKPLIDAISIPIFQNILNINVTQIENILNNLKSYEQLILVVRNLVTCFEFNKFEGFATEEELVDVGMDMINQGTFWAGIVFKDDNSNSSALPNLINYKIRMSTSFTHNTFFAKDRYYVYGPNNCPTCNIDFLYGYIYLQDMIEKGIIEMKTNSTQDYGITMHMSGYPCYVNDLFVNAITRTLPLFMVLAWIYTVSMLVKDIVYEKEKRLKEFMRVMGLSNGIHWLAWFITAFVTMFFICILLVIILKYGKITQYSDFSALLVFFVCFSMATITQCFLISVFFNRANLAAAVGGIIYFLLYLPYSVLVNYADVLESYQEFLASLSSTVAFGYGCQLLGVYELQSIGINWQNFYESPYENGGLSMNTLCLVMLFDAFIYMLFTWYIENIAPGEFGIARPLYFPFQPSYWLGDSYKKKFKNCGCCCGKKSSTKKNFINGYRNGNYINGNENGVNEIDLDGDKGKIGIEINNLHKIYSRGRNHALKGLTLNFYENEITSFLGHNGAGKSTTMHILTGLYEPSSGTAKINGMDITENMDEIRKSLGFVPQHNVLFDNITVANHLWFYALMKGLGAKETEIETNKLLEDTGLVKKRDELAKNLSGGMQRKLSVAIAFVGGSKTVILDEPSAGVDPNGRRGIWDLLFKYRTGRTIIISTHHMDEADILGDRIAIIANGKLVCFGSSFSLKNKYGRGYYLTLIKKEISNESAETSEINNNSLLDVPNDNASTSTDSRMTEFDSLKSDSSIIENVDDIEDIKSIQNQTDALKTLRNPQDISIYKFIKSRIGNAVLFENIGNEMTFTISNKQQYTKDYEQFFRDIESNLEVLGIDGITISDTTLEEIFVKLAKQPETIAKSRICNCCTCTDLNLSCLSDKICVFCRNKERIGLDSTNNSTVSSNVKSDKILYHKKNSVNVSEDTLKKYAAYTKSRVSVVRWPLQQLYGLTIKRFHRLKRNIKGFIAEIVLPIIFVCLALLVSISVPPILPRPALEIHPWLYGNADNYIYYSEGISGDNFTNTSSIPMDSLNITDTFFKGPSLGTRCTTNHTISVTSYTNNFRTNTITQNLLCLNSSYTLAPLNEPNEVFSALLSVNYSSTKISPKCVCDTGFPICPIGAGGDVDYRKSMSKLLTNDTLIDLTGRNISDWLIKTELSDKYLRNRYGGFEFLNTYFPQQSVDNFYSILTTLVGLFSTNFTLKPSEILSKTGLITNKRVKVWYNNKGYYAHIGYLNTLNNAILRSKILTLNQSAKLEDYGIVSVNHPMNYTNGDLVSLLTVQVFIDLFVAICIIFALSFIPASFLVFLVEERENHCKQLQFISGVKPYIYWMSNFTWDLLNFCIPCLLCVIVFVAFDVKSYMAPENFPCMVALMLLYGWSCIPLMYPLNYIFQIPSSAFVLSSCLNVFVGVISTMTTTILEQLSSTEPDLYQINEIIKPIFICLFPHYCLGRGFIDMAIQYNMAVAERTLGNKEYTFNPFKFELVGRNLLALAVQGVVYFSINMLIEYKFFIHIKPSKIPKPKLKATTTDEDVEKERKRILEKIKENNQTKIKRGNEKKIGINGGNYLEDDKKNNTKKRQKLEEVREDYITLENLTKVYRRFKKCSFKKHVAVKSLCLGINKGECFGLIGVNGAGKTTTFKMLTGDIPITAGDCKVNGFSVSEDIQKVHQNIGYCPQKDAIFPLLTAREHLLFYGRLRGIPEKHIEKVGIWALNRVGLNVFADRMAVDFSGGNKRKLATAIALVGDPSVIALDEPTSGMDAKARRLLWNDILSLIKEDRIVILTSHSMEECEALCTRLVIMVNGEFKCLGSPKHLKLKFGSGYKVAIRLNNEIDCTKLLNFMKINFPTSILNEIHKNLIEFTLPFKDSKLSTIFGKIEENRIYLNIKDYSVSQTTLDQIFVDFAKAQEEEGVEVEKPHIYNTKEYRVENGFENQNYPSETTNILHNNNINEFLTYDDHRIDSTQL